MKYINNLLSLFILLAFASCSGEKANTLTEEEKADGWKLLFDGQTMNGWRDYNGTTLQEPWEVVNGCIQAKVNTKNGRGFIVTDQEYDNFILSWEWKLSKGGNSGMLYHIIERPEYKLPYVTGPEYQLIDEANFKGKLQEWQRLGVDYAMYCPDKSKKHVNPQGEWNNSRIVFDNGHVEHWLNGEKILEFEAWSDDWFQRKAKGKWAKNAEYGLNKKGVIALQDHGNPASFRNIKIKELPRKSKKQVLFDGSNLNLWNSVSAGKWEIKNQLLSSITENKEEFAYLMSREYFDNFEMTAEVKSKDLNWGIFGRSYINNKKLDGCVIRLGEKESGLFTSCKVDECIQPIEAEKVKSSFKSDDWNQVKLKMQDGQIQLWINDQQVLDVKNDKLIQKKGALGLILLENSTSEILWRNISVLSL